MQAGTVVRILSGRDSGKLMMVTSGDENSVFVADGKRRKLAKPKRKNIKHIAATDIIIEEALVTGNKKLIRLLKNIGDKATN